MNVRQIKKNVNNRMRFDSEMYNTLLGSFLISLKILNATDKTDAQLKKLYKKEKREWLLGRIDEKTWLNDLAVKAEATIPYGNIAYVQSKYNQLIVPYVDGQIFPIREDGVPTRTLREGKIYPIVENTSEEE